MKQIILAITILACLLVIGCEDCKDIGESCSSDDDCCSERCGTVQGKGQVCMLDN